MTTTVYDDAGRIATVIDNDVTTPALATDDVTTSYFYDEFGRQAAVRSSSKDAGTQTVSRSIFDDAGRVTSEIRGCTDSGTTLPAQPETCTGAGTRDADHNVATDSVYDARGNRIRMTVPDPAATSGTSTATVTTQYAYDSGDRLCRVVEHATGSTDLQALADPCSDPTQTAGTTTANVSTRYTYDGIGNLATVIDATGATTSYGYDAQGRMTSLTDPLGETLSWVHDSRGNRIRQEDRADPPLTASVQWTYDAAGRMLTRVADGTTTSYTYDANGNKLTATDGTLTITATYDRLNRPLTIDDEDAGTTADTTYTYSLANPAWTDPTGAYSATLDSFDRPTALNDPADASDFRWTYGSDGQVLAATAPDGNDTDRTYDTLGRLTGSDTDTTPGAGGTDRAVYTYTYNRAGQTLSEASTISGDPSNGTVTYAYDPLGRLTSAALAGTTTTYGFDADVNRTSVKVGAGTPATTSYDAADRPTSGADPAATYTSDDDGRLTARPGYQYTWDHLGRLVTVKNGGGTTLATYGYDPLDRLRLIDHGGSDRTRLRYVGLTTRVAQWLDDVAGTVTRSVANGWSGERLLDWTGTNSNIRIYGTNGHHDVTWLAGSTGTVSAALRYDPWGTPRTTVPTGYTPFRFQGSYLDDTSGLAWVVTRWYAHTLGRFISEDTLLGDPADPPSRHLYAYGAGEPVGRWDPDGRTALGTCGGWGCTASNSGSTRQMQWSAYFRRFPGYTRVYSRVGGITSRLSGTGRGSAMISFMDWIRRSGRIARSDWWDRVNREEVQSSLTAWRRVDRTIKYVRVAIADSSYPWAKYIKSRKFDPPGVSPLGYYGGTFRQAWDAHQRSLWNGIKAAGKYLAKEPKAEQLFILKVVSNVELYARSGMNLDGFLDLFKTVGGYPETYPATKRQACDAGWANTVLGLFTNYRAPIEKEVCG